MQQNLILSSLDSHHKQYTYGIGLQIGGTLLSALVLSNDNSNDNSLGAVGALVSFIGGLIVLDSNKWFSKRKSIIKSNHRNSKNILKTDFENISATFHSNTLETVNPSKKENPDYIIFEGEVYSVGDKVDYQFSNKSVVIKKFIKNENSRYFYDVELEIKFNNKIKIKQTTLEEIIRQ